MKRYILRRKWLCLLTLAAVVLFNLINAERSILDQKLIDAVLALESENILSMMLLVIGMSVFSGASYVAAQLLKNALSVTVVDDMRKAYSPASQSEAERTSSRSITRTIYPPLPTI